MNTPIPSNQPITSSPVSPITVRVLDPLVRVFHWSLVLFFFTAYLSEAVSDTLHVWCGYAVAGLISVRVLWGLIGTKHARFTDFVRSPRSVLAYLKAIPAGKAPRYLGHNPAGGAMVVALLLSLTGTIVFGIATPGAHDQAGPLAGTWLASFNDHTLKEIHQFFANSTLALVFLHIAGVLSSSLQQRENLVRSMIHGRRQRRDNDH